MKTKFIISTYSYIRKRFVIGRRSEAERGFGIVELITATFVFSMMSIVVATNFVDVLNLQRRGFAAQVIQEEILFAVEMMTREIRVSQIQSPDDLNCATTSLSIDHPINGPTVYSVGNGVISKTVGGNTFSITSSKVNFSRLNFCIRGSGVDDEQPRVTIVTSVQPTDGTDLRFDIQTGVSSRDLREELLN
ncbi:MAG: hypothetical protein HYX22_00615 [Candidatus Yanofskybacteria bacterium]|nr:hypothetical protein [Candidatus Yanofskybacteria bacterium]